MQVSSHFYIRRNGELWQFVSCDDRAWHAGVSCYRGRDNCNDDSIGIELEGLEGESFEAGQYETLGSLCAALGQRYPVQHIAGHEHVAPGRKADPGPGSSGPCCSRPWAGRLGIFPKRPPEPDHPATAHRPRTHPRKSGRADGMRSGAENPLPCRMPAGLRTENDVTSSGAPRQR